MAARKPWPPGSPIRPGLLATCEAAAMAESMLLLAMLPSARLRATSLLSAKRERGEYEVVAKAVAYQP
ncbi:hypothetical protein GW17_00032746 [Ensete ventricosum]|nr:hypothetical protein GW17_00032746 [Ensete ventricosum]RZR82341.1 hypothetical protein BHM03_00008738 [Ensete ventricosum]